MQLTQTRLVGLTFRATSPRYSDLHRTAAMSPTYPGRFDTPSVGAVYVSREPETAVEELRRRAARDGVSLADMHPRSIFVIDLHLHELVDLTAPGQLEAWGLTPKDLVSDDMARCQEAAGVAARLGAEGIRWTSTAPAIVVGRSRPDQSQQAARRGTARKEFVRRLVADPWNTKGGTLG